MHLKELSVRVQQLVEQSEEVLFTKSGDSSARYSVSYVDSGKLAGLRASVLSFITMVYGKDHSHYSEFDTGTQKNYESSAKKQRAWNTPCHSR